MIELLKENWIFSVISALIIGALGSGLWDVAFKPMFKKIGEGLFFVLTLGISRAEDSIYKEAAKGNREQGGMYVARHLTGIISGFLIASCIIFVQAPERILEIKNTSTICESKSESNEISSCLDEVREKNLDKLENLLVVYIPGAVFMAVVLMYSSLWMGAVNRVVTDYNQYISICRPWISEDEFFSINRDYALMSKKSDFERILNKLNEIATSNNVALPRYSDDNA